MSLPGLPRLNYRVKATSNALEFWWQAPLNDGGKAITGYNLWCSSIPYSTIIGSSTFYAKASSLTNSQDYVFQLAAINTVGTGAFTNYEIAQPGIISQTGVTSLSVVSNSRSTATVSWTFSNGANEATNKYFAITMFPSSPNATMSTFKVAAYANQRSAVISGLSTNYYTFLVQSINDAGYYYPNVSTLAYIRDTPGPSRVSGLQVWFDASDPYGTGAVPANGTTITTWADKSANAYNAVATGSPQLATNSQNSLPGIAYVGNTGPTIYYTATIPARTFANATTLFIVYKNTASNSSNGLVTRSRATSNIGNPDIGNTSIVVNNTASSYGYNGYGVPSVYNTNTSLYEVVVDQVGNAVNAWSNGNVVSVNYQGYGTLTPGTADATLDKLYLGTRGDLGSSFQGIFYEIIAYNTIPSLANRQLIEGYLAWKWGLQGSLPGAHPYKSVAPT